MKDILTKEQVLRSLELFNYSLRVRLGVEKLDVDKLLALRKSIEDGYVFTYKDKDAELNLYTEALDDLFYYLTGDGFCYEDFLMRGFHKVDPESIYVTAISEYFTSKSKDSDGTIKYI